MGSPPAYRWLVAQAKKKAGKIALAGLLQATDFY
jgi:hypothetical protein